MLSSRSSEATEVELHLLSSSLSEPYLDQDIDAEARNQGSASPAVATAHEDVSPTTLHHRSNRFPNTTPEPSFEQHQAFHTNVAVPQDPCLHVDTGEWWTPEILRRRSLYTFVTFYSCAMISLVLLAIIDQKTTGIATVRSEWHYAWTYGPTLGTVCRMLIL
jgi:hypothetical protein